MPLKYQSLFYHIWAPAISDIWQMVVDEQLNRIASSGLLSQTTVFCCISGPHYASIRDFVSFRPWVTILQATPDEAHYEGLTLSALHDHCNTRPGLDAVGYMHTKGIRYFGHTDARTFRALNGWRHLLEWGTLDLWREATSRLARFDAVGVNYRDGPWPHFGGNFWWARPSHIRSLPRPSLAALPPAEGIGDVGNDRERVSYEKWIGQGNPRLSSMFGYPFELPNLPADFGHNLYADDISPYLGRFAR